MTGGLKIRVVLCFVFFVVVAVQCQERITIFTSSGENEIDYEKPSEKSTDLTRNNKKHSDKPLSVELAKSTKPNLERIFENTPKTDPADEIIIYDKNGVKIEAKISDKRSSNSKAELTENAKNTDDKELTGKDKILERNVESRKLDNIFSTNNKTPLKDLEKSNKSPGIVCPERDLPRPLFAPSCSASKDCVNYGNDMLCCGRQCLKGVKPPRIQTQHDPIFFGMIHRKCPSDPLPELSEVKECKTDSDCFPRICCTEALQNGDTANYCRTPEPLWDNLPIPNQVLDPLKMLVAYMQCTPPPPPIFDLFPKSCQNPLDCFPNLCCQERGKRYCRPPKRSILALVADIGTRLIPENTAKKLIERISR